MYPTPNLSRNITEGDVYIEPAFKIKIECPCEEWSRVYFPFVKWISNAHDDSVMLDGFCITHRKPTIVGKCVLRRGYALLKEKSSGLGEQFDSAYVAIYENRFNKIYVVGSTFFGAWAASYARNMSSSIKIHVDEGINHLEERAVTAEAAHISLSNEFDAEVSKRDMEIAELRKKLEAYEASKRSSWWGIRA